MKSNSHGKNYDVRNADFEIHKIRIHEAFTPCSSRFIICHDMEEWGEKDADGSVYVKSIGLY